VLDVSLNFSEDFIDFDVCVCGFESEEIAKRFTNSNPWLILSPTGLDLVLGSLSGEVFYPIDRERVNVTLDTKWNDRIPLDPSKLESMVKIQQAMVDFENGIDNPYNMKDEDYELVDWSFEKIFRKLECTKARLAIKQYLASGTSLSATIDIDRVASEFSVLCSG
jgi:hypothetical protein